MKKYIILILLLCLVRFSNAQAPGYLGKRLLIGGSVVVGSPNFGNEPPSYYEESLTGEYNISIHKYFKVSCDYVFSTRKSVYAAFKHASMGYLNNEFNSAYNYHFGNNSYYQYVISKLDIRTLDIGFKYHLNGNIAPLGKFIMFGFSFHSARETDPDMKFAKRGVMFTDTTINIKSAFFGLGTNYILNQFIVISTSIETNLNASFVYDFDYSHSIKSRWQKSCYLNAGIGIGFLIF